MNKIETVVAEQAIDEAIVELRAVELTLPELDFVAGGNVVVGLA